MNAVEASVGDRPRLVRLRRRRRRSAGPGRQRRGRRGRDSSRKGGLAALVSRVPLSEYGEEPVRARLEDPDWLEAKARAHEAVLEGALRPGAGRPVSPAHPLPGRASELRDFLAEPRRRASRRPRAGARQGRARRQGVRRSRAARPALASHSDGAATSSTPRSRPPRPGRRTCCAGNATRPSSEQTTRVLRDVRAGMPRAPLGGREAAVSNPPQPRELLRTGGGDAAQRRVSGPGSTTPAWSRGRRAPRRVRPARRPARADRAPGRRTTSSLATWPARDA